MSFIMTRYLRIMGTPFLAVNADDCLSRSCCQLTVLDKCGDNWNSRLQRGLAGLAIVEIAIHIEPAKRPFYRVDRPVLIAIQLLEMVVGQFRIVGIRNARTKMTPARIVALRAFQHAVVHEIGSWLHDSFRRPLPMNLHTSMALRTHRTYRLQLSRCRLGLLLNSFRLAFRSNRHRALLGTLARWVLSLLELTPGKFSCDYRSRLF